MPARRASYDKKTLARQVIPLAPSYRTALLSRPAGVYGNDAMLRQIAESVRINRVTKGSLINMKTEWDHIKLPRVVLDKGKCETPYVTGQDTWYFIHWVLEYPESKMAEHALLG